MKYLSQPLMPMPVSLALFIDRKAYFAWAKRLKILGVTEFVSNDANGCCHYFENDKTGATLVAVCLDPEKLEGLDSIKIASLIVHEATHVYQECMEFIGEKDPGREFEAYSIQHISEQLMRAYVEQTSRG